MVPENSTPTVGAASSEAALGFIADQLKDCTFRGIDGFFARYFEGKSWSPDVQAKVERIESTEAGRKLVADAANQDSVAALTGWLDAVDGLCDLDGCFRCEPLGDGPPTARITLQRLQDDIDDLPQSSGPVCVFGEYRCRRVGGPEAAEGDDNDDLLPFYACAVQLFNQDPSRRFMHGFLISGTTLELWVFDRSGVFSSGQLDLKKRPERLVQVLCSYALMEDDGCGLDRFIERSHDLAGVSGGWDRYVTFDGSEKFHLSPTLVAAPDYLVGLGTTCYAASRSATGKPDIVVKFSWREDEAHLEVRQLELARKRNAWGVVRLLDSGDLGSVASHRRGLDFPQPFVNRTLSCVVTEPLGRLIRKYDSITELMEVLRDLVKALRSLYVDAGIIHRDIAIKNLVIAPPGYRCGVAGEDGPRGVLIDFDQALDLEHECEQEPLIGSDGFMAIGILSGQRHTYRHDLESLFYVFLWLAIAADREHDEASQILESLPDTSRLRAWVSMDFGAVGRTKLADMSPEGFGAILGEFREEFASLKHVGRELHALLFPLRDGEIFTGTDTDPVAVEQMYEAMAGIFDQCARMTRL